MKGLWFFSILAYAIAGKYRLKFILKNILWLITVTSAVADLRKICQRINWMYIKTNQSHIKSTKGRQTLV